MKRKKKISRPGWLKLKKNKRPRPRRAWLKT